MLLIIEFLHMNVNTQNNPAACSIMCLVIMVIHVVVISYNLETSYPMRSLNKPTSTSLEENVKFDSLQRGE